jgi:hypothetical protein
MCSISPGTHHCPPGGWGISGLDRQWGRLYYICSRQRLRPTHIGSPHSRLRLSTRCVIPARTIYGRLPSRNDRPRSLVNPRIQARNIRMYSLLGQTMNGNTPAPGSNPQDSHSPKLCQSNKYTHLYSSIDRQHQNMLCHSWQ